MKLHNLCCTTPRRPATCWKGYTLSKTWITTDSIHKLLSARECGVWLQSNHWNIHNWTQQTDINIVWLAAAILRTKQRLLSCSWHLCVVKFVWPCITRENVQKNAERNVKCGYNFYLKYMFCIQYPMEYICEYLTRSIFGYW